MAIIKRKANQRIIIDLDGPDGNAYALMGYVISFGQTLEWSKQEIDKVLNEMKAKDYENLLLVFDKYFGNFCDLMRD